MSRVITQPGVAIEQNARLFQDLTKVALNVSDLEPSVRDRRFSDKAWNESPVYRRAVRNWMAWRKNLEEWVEKIELDDRDRRRARFFVELVVDAFSPTNFLLGNPEALRHAKDTRGASLATWVQELPR